MVLEPCPTCHRHIADDEVHCPFCGAAHVEREPRAMRMIAGRWSRAAIFAGGALLAPACGSTPPSTTTGPTDISLSTGRIAGKATGDRTGAPIRGTVYFFDEAGKSYAAAPDVNGDFTIEVPPGTYKTSVPRPFQRRGPPLPDTVITTVVKAGATATVNLTFHEPDPDAQKMPYGAPPARRRLV
jgi:hypothetical protein